MRLSFYKCYLVCTVFLNFVSGVFRHIPALFKSICTLIQNFVYSWHFQNPGLYLLQSIFRLQGIFIILYKTFLKMLIFDLWYSSECAALLQMLSNFQSNFTVSLTLYLSYILAYSRRIQVYLFLIRLIKNPRIYRNILLQTYSGMHILNSTHSILALLLLFRTLAYLGTFSFRHIQLYLLR